MAEELRWPVPWEPVGGAAGMGEAGRELGPGHVLCGLAARMAGRHAGTDGALFLLGDGRVAEVHLTWRGEREDHPRWPGTVVYPSLAAWATACVGIGRQDFTDVESRALEMA